MQLTGLTVWKEDHLGGIQQSCYEEVLKDTAQWTDPNGTPSLPAAITSALCPLDCSSQGQCVDGTSICITYQKHVLYTKNYILLKLPLKVG